MDILQHKNTSEAQPAEMFPGIVRRTLCYGDDNMLCHFTMKKGAKIPLHSHKAVQNGYIISGCVKFFTEDGTEIIAKAGEGYFLESMQAHGSEVLEDSELIECFSPMRPEYLEK